jgi:hypothetical protein
MFTYQDTFVVVVLAVSVVLMGFCQCGGYEGEDEEGEGCEGVHGFSLCRCVYGFTLGVFRCGGDGLVDV